MSDPNALYAEAEQLKDDGQLEAAEGKLKEILQSDASYIKAHLALSVVLTRLGRHDEAIEHGRKAIEIDPSDPFNYTALSVTCQRAWAGTQDQKYIQMAEDAMAQSHSVQRPE